MGLDAEALQNRGYRDAKIRTILDTVPKMLGPEGAGNSRELRWTGSDGSRLQSAAIILVSNNVYRLGAVPGAGTRPRLDGDIPVGVDGEALILPTPLVFRTCPSALRVRAHRNTPPRRDRPRQPRRTGFAMPSVA